MVQVAHGSRRRSKRLELSRFLGLVALMALGCVAYSHMGLLHTVDTNTASTAPSQANAKNSMSPPSGKTANFAECVDGTETFDLAEAELIHIPRTGGTSLEVLGSQNGINWGACHYIPGIIGGNKCKPDYPATWEEMLQQTKHGIVYWHLPYEHLPTKSKAIYNGTKMLIATVRNPTIVSSLNTPTLQGISPPWTQVITCGAPT